MANALKLSLVIPAQNEEGSIAGTVETLAAALGAESIPFEIVVVDDGSSDGTAAVVRALARKRPEVRLVENRGRHGFGLAVRAGLEEFQGDAVAIVMADGSDSPGDLVSYYRKLEEGYDCVFGSRFQRGAKIYDYPIHKLILNRMANRFIGLLFGFRYNDTTNAFKCYRRHAVEGMQPLIAPHFNLTVEMPLKAMVRGYSYAVVPTNWTNRKTGVSKLKIKEMGSRYLFIVLYLWLEKHLARGDYARHHHAGQALGEEMRATEVGGRK
jgi:dolichol-phosphate mannosyltransferase